MSFMDLGITFLNFHENFFFSKKAKFDPYGNVELPNCASSTSHFSQNICA